MMRHGIRAHEPCHIRTQVPYCLGPEVSEGDFRRTGSDRAQTDIQGDRRAVRVRNCGTRSDAGPRALVCECAAAIQSSGTGQNIEERVLGPADERAPGNARDDVGRALVELGILRASHRRDGERFCDSKVHPEPASERRQTQTTDVRVLRCRPPCGGGVSFPTWFPER